MPKIHDNIVTEGLRGMLGRRIVFRRGRRGTTIVSARPVFSADRTFSSHQVEHQQAFKQAIAYARGNKSLPAYKSRAQATDSTSFNVAVSDWFHPPQVLEIDVNGFTGCKDQTLRIKAVDDIIVTHVHVVIYGADATALEEGEAVLSSHHETCWIYTVTSDLLVGCAARVSAIAEDLPGHRHELIVSL